MKDVSDHKVTTIEGLSPDGNHRCRKPGVLRTCLSAATASADRS
jgi:hypothetical protein